MKDKLTEGQKLSYSIESTPMADTELKEKTETRIGANGKPETPTRESEKKKRMKLFQQARKLRENMSAGDKRTAEKLQRQLNELTGKDNGVSAQLNKLLLKDPENAKWIEEADAFLKKFQKEDKLAYNRDAKDPEEIAKIVQLLSQNQKSFDQEVKDFEASIPLQDSPTQLIRDIVNTEENFSQILFAEAISNQEERIIRQAAHLTNPADKEAVGKAIKELFPQVNELLTPNLFKDNDFRTVQTVVGRILDQVDATAEDIARRIEAQGGISVPPSSEQNNNGGNNGNTAGGESGGNGRGSAGQENNGNGNNGANGETNSGNAGIPGGGDGNNNVNGRNQESLPPGVTPERLGYGKIGSIEDVAHYMELLDPNYLTQDENNRILKAREVDGQKMIAFPEQSRDTIKYVYEKGTRDHIFQLPQNEVQEIYDALHRSNSQEIRDNIIAKYRKQYVENQDESLQKLSPESYAAVIDAIGTGSYEEVRVVDPANFMNWIRDKWVLLHNDDPDNPQMNFFQGIAIDHPDMIRGVSVGQIHQNPGTFLRSKFLVDEDNQRVVYKSLREELIKEVWITGSVRNYEVLFKKVMPIDEELFKTFRDQIASGNLYAKAAIDKSTMATLFSFPQDFKEKFGMFTGKKEDILHDTKLGNSVLLSYLIYFNVSDIGKLQELLGNKQTIFNRKSIMKAVSDIIKCDVEDEAKIRAYLATNVSETILDKNIFDANGNLDLSGEKEKRDKNLKIFMDFFNPFVPAQKDPNATSVIRKMIENQVQSITGIRSGGSGSEFGELLAWLMVYHTGAAARHDMPMNNRNSQAKYEFVQAYKDKQLGRDAAGNIYNLNTLKRAVVGMMTGMPTRRGETIMSILDEAEDVRKEFEKAYEPTHKKVEQKRKELEGTIESTDEFQIMLQEIQRQQLSDAQAKQKKEAFKKQKIEEILRSEFSQYKEHDTDLSQAMNKVLERLEFDDAQFTQYAGMQYTNGAQLFLDDMTGADMPIDKISGLDHEGRRFIKADSFGEWIQGVEKRMRYTISTWPLPLGSLEKRLVNPRGKGPPEFKEMTMCETIFGDKHSPVLQMFQEMLEREVKKANKNRPAGEQLKINNFRFATKDGTVTDAGREKLRKILGYVEKTTDENGNAIVTKHESNVDFAEDGADRMLVKAYVKVRIGRFIQSHTDEASPYETWEVPLREGFFGGLKLSQYFTSQDVEDIRNHSHNGYWSNFRRESMRGLGKGFKEGFGKGLSAFFKAVTS